MSFTPLCSYRLAASGPRTALNRFFQVPQCSGMGYRDVSSHAEMRA